MDLFLINASPRETILSHNGLGIEGSLITEHPVYQLIARSSSERRLGYRELFQVFLDKEDEYEKTHSLHANQIMGAERFFKRIEATPGRRVGRFG